MFIHIHLELENRFAISFYGIRIRKRDTSKKYYTHTLPKKKYLLTYILLTYTHTHLLINHTYEYILYLHDKKIHSRYHK